MPVATAGAHRYVAPVLMAVEGGGEEGGRKVFQRVGLPPMKWREGASEGEGKGEVGMYLPSIPFPSLPSFLHPSYPPFLPSSLPPFLPPKLRAGGAGDRAGRGEIQKKKKKNDEEREHPYLR